MIRQEVAIILARQAYGSRKFTWDEFCMRYPGSEKIGTNDGSQRSAADWLRLLHGPPPSQGSK